MRWTNYCGASEIQDKYKNLDPDNFLFFLAKGKRGNRPSLYQLITQAVRFQSPTLTEVKSSSQFNVTVLCAFHYPRTEELVLKMKGELNSVSLFRINWGEWALGIFPIQVIVHNNVISWGSTVFGLNTVCSRLCPVTLPFPIFHQPTHISRFSFILLAAYYPLFPSSNYMS